MYLIIHMARKGYTTIALPNALIDEIDSIIKLRKYGYKTRPELIKEAIREKITLLSR